MLWRRRQAEQPGVERDALVPAALDVPLNPRVLESKLERMLEALEDHGGLAEFVAALGRKHELFAQALDRQALAQLSREGLEALLERVFTARRKLPAALFALGQTQLNEAIGALLYGDGAIDERMRAFAAQLPVSESGDKAAAKSNAKLRRAALDLAAELLHFRDPARYPLMTRWVWDMNTESGAMREFLTGADTFRGVPFDNRPETFEAMRVWMSEQLTTQGFYRDVHFLIDLVLAWAYADYMKAMSNRLGMIEAEFGGKQDPTEPLQKLLGIDPAPPSGRSRLKSETVH